MSYVTQTQKASLKHITRVRPFLAERHVPIDRATRRALELTETFRGEHGATLLSTFDRTSTALGARKLRDWILSPLTDIAAIVLRQDAVAEIGADPDFAEKLTGLLGQAHDLERISTRISYRSANARDLVALKRTLDLLPQLRELLRAASSSLLHDCGDRMVEPPGLAAAIAAALVDEPPLSVKEGGLVRKGHDAALDELREIATQGTRWIARFQEEEARKTAIPSLKVGFNKVFGYYIEVTNTHREKIPDRYIRKQTLKGCERFVTAELKDYETKVLHAKDRAIEIEHEIFARIREEAAGHIATIQAAADAIAEADVVATFGIVAKERGYTRPTVNDGLRLSIEDGRHPVIERIAGADRFIPNSVDLDPERSIMIITGPNMAGKSTYIRQVAILTLLAQTGSFIPARSAEIGIIDRVFTRVGASDDLARGHSTFMVEMNETANILNNVSRRGLIILDEVGRGTSTFDGVSLAWAITEHIAERIGARTLFATHYHELTALSLTFPTVRNFNFAVKEWNDDIIFLRKIVEGGSDKSYGIHVARLAGIPREVLDRAREILSNLESQELDIHDQPALASRKHAPGARDPGGPNAVRMRQLDLFQDSNDAVLKELKKLEIDHMTPVEALQRLLDLKKRIV